MVVESGRVRDPHAGDRMDLVGAWYSLAWHYASKAG